MAEEILSSLKQAIIGGDAEGSDRLTKEAIGEGMTATEILDGSLIPGIREIGEQFANGDCYLPELIVSGRAMEAAIDHLEPLFSKEESGRRGKFIIGTVLGDVHDIGKKIVVIMLKGSGWEIIDLGVDVTPEDFCQAVKESDAHVLGMSALLTTSMGNIIKTIRLLKEAGLRDRIKIIIGGAPVNQEFADEAGADAFGRDGWEAVVKAEKLLKASS